MMLMCNKECRLHNRLPARVSIMNPSSRIPGAAIAPRQPDDVGIQVLEFVLDFARAGVYRRGSFRRTDPAELCGAVERWLERLR